MTTIKPPRVQNIVVSTTTPEDYWTENDGSGWLNVPYSYRVVFDVDPQPTSYANSAEPYYYTGLDVSIND